jgi:hypothetical protein
MNADGHGFKEIVDATSSSHDEKRASDGDVDSTNESTRLGVHGEV